MQQRRPDFALFEREIYALSRDDVKAHTNIIQISSWGFDYPSYNNSDLPPILMIEKAIGSVKSFLKSEDPGAAVKHQLCLDIAEGTRHVHSCNIVQGDLKPDNVLVVKSGNPRVPYIAKLADFGAFINLDVSILTAMTYSCYTGTQGWRPPEVQSNESQWREVVPRQLFFKCDCYSYGLLVASVFLQNGQRPCIPQSMKDWRDETSIAEPLATLLYNQVSPLLSPDPSSRPRMTPELLFDETETYKNWYVATLSFPFDIELTAVGTSQE